MNFKEYCLLNQKNFDQVKSIEKEVYPSRMQTYQDFDNIEDLLDYADCNGQIDCIVKNDWYAIFCNGAKEVEIIDLASRKPLSLIELIEVKNKLLSFGDKIITMNARESTSYKLIMAAAKRGMFEILSDEPNNEFGEPMHELVLKKKQQNSFKEWFSIQEAIDASTKELLLKAKAPKDELDAFVKELEDEPNLIDKKTAFQRFQTKFNIQKKEKDEDAQRKHFASVPNTTEEELKTYDYYKNENPQVLKEMMELLRKFIDKKLITLKFENNKPVLIRNTLQGEQKQNTPDFTRFMSSLHGIQASLNQFKSKGTYFNPIEEELNHQNNLVAKGYNVWVFKGHAPDLCRIYGKGTEWCISSTSSAAHWFSYRINHHQTQYFVFDFNKDENDPARYVNPGVAPEGEYSEWVDARNQHSTDPEDRNSEVGINGYKSIREYKEYLASKGIPLDTWKTTEPEKWEERLNNYDYDKDFQGAKNDSDPRVFQMYLKIINAIEDYDFEKLTEEQKKEFILGKTALTDKQLNYAFKNFKGEYYNSLDAKEKNELLKKSIIKNYTELIKYLIQKNVEIPNSAVSDVAENGHLDIVKYLVEKKGANISVDAVSHAAINGHLDIVKYLVEKGAKISDDAVEYAARSGNLALVKYFVEKGANISDDAISYAAKNGHLDIVKYLVENGAKIIDIDINLAKTKEIKDYLIQKQKEQQAKTPST